MMKKIPWGIIAGSLLMLISFITVGIIAVFVISNMMYAAVGSDDGLRESWWLIPLYIGDVISVISFVISMFFYFKKEKMIEEEMV